MRVSFQYVVFILLLIFKIKIIIYNNKLIHLLENQQSKKNELASNKRPICDVDYDAINTAGILII